MAPRFLVNDDGLLLHQGRVCVPNDVELRQIIMKEAYDSTFAMHPGGTKMYRIVKEHYWWMGIKKEIAEYVSKCLTCQQVKTEHQVPSSLLQPLPIPE